MKNKNNLPQRFNHFYLVLFIWLFLCPAIVQADNSDPEADPDKVIEETTEGANSLENILGDPNRFLNNDNLQTYEIIKYNKLLHDLMRLNRNLDRQVFGTLSPGDSSQTSGLYVPEAEQRRYHLGYTIDNHGIQLTGKLHHSLAFYTFNLSGHDDALFNTFAASNEGLYYGDGLYYILPITDNGGRVAFSYIYSSVKLGEEFEPFDVTAGGNIWNLEYVHPLVEQDNTSIELNAGLKVKEIWSHVGGNSNTRNHLRVAHFGQRLLMRDDMGATIAGNTFDVGIPGFLGSDDDGDFFVDNLELSRAQNFLWESLLHGSFHAQFAGDALPSAQQFRVGGFETVRGYDQDESLGDYGFLESVEWRVPPYFLSKDWQVPGRNETFWQTLQFLTFLDVANVYLHKPISGQERNRSLIGTGVGMRFNLTQRVNAQFDCGWPIGEKPVGSDRSANLHFSFNLNF